MEKICFECDDETFQDLEKLTKVLNLENYNETLIFSVNYMVEVWLEKIKTGEFILVETKRLYTMLEALHRRIRELDPNYQLGIRTEENIEIARRIYELYKTGKRVEADKLRNENPEAFYGWWPGD